MLYTFLLTSKIRLGTPPNTDTTGLGWLWTILPYREGDLGTNNTLSSAIMARVTGLFGIRPECTTLRKYLPDKYPTSAMDLLDRSDPYYCHWE